MVRRRSITVILSLIGILAVLSVSLIFQRKPEDAIKAQPVPKANASGPTENRVDGHASSTPPKAQKDSPSSNSEPLITKGYRVGDADWFAIELLRPLYDQLMKVDPKGQTGNGMRFLLQYLKDDSVSFESRMRQAAAIRLIPFAVRGNPALAPEAVSRLTELIASDDVATFTRVSAISSLFGFKLNGDILRAASGPLAGKEFYFLHYDHPFASNEPDTYSLKSVALTDQAFRETLRRVLLGDCPRQLRSAGYRALLRSPNLGAQDRTVFYHALQVDNLNSVAKGDVLDWLIKNPDSQTIPKLMALAASAQAENNNQESIRFDYALATLGVAEPRIILRCKESLQGTNTSFPPHFALRALVRIHSRTGSKECSATLERIISDPTSRRRSLAVNIISQEKDKRMLAFLKSTLNGEQDPKLRGYLLKAISTLSSDAGQ